MIPFMKPMLGKEEQKAVLDVLKSGWINTGSVCREFETKMRRYTEAKINIATSSCTAALELALKIELHERWPTWKSGKYDVITTPMTFIATPFAIKRAGFHPVFADVRVDGFHLDPEILLATIRKKYKSVGGTLIHRENGHHLKGIVPVHYGGASYRMHEINAIAKEYNLFVVEDAAHALGGFYDESPGLIGSSGNWVCFSFHTTKNITTAEGGALVKRDTQRFSIHYKHLINHGINKTEFRRKKFGIPMLYNIKEVGVKANMPDILAALGVVQLDKLNDVIKKRRELCYRYDSLIYDIKGVQTGKVFDSYEDTTGHLYPILIENLWGFNRKNECDHFTFFKDHYGIEVSQHFIPCFLFDCFNPMAPYTDNKLNWEYYERAYPNTMSTFKRLVTLPIYPQLTHQEQEKITDAVEELTRKI